MGELVIAYQALVPNNQVTSNDVEFFLRDEIPGIYFEARDISNPILLNEARARDKAKVKNYLQNTRLPTQPKYVEAMSRVYFSPYNAVHNTYQICMDQTCSRFSLDNAKQSNYELIPYGNTNFTKRVNREDAIKIEELLDKRFSFKTHFSSYGGAFNNPRELLALMKFEITKTTLEPREDKKQIHAKLTQIIIFGAMNPDYRLWVTPFKALVIDVGQPGGY